MYVNEMYSSCMICFVCSFIQPFSSFGICLLRPQIELVYGLIWTVSKCNTGHSVNLSLTFYDIK